MSDQASQPVNFVDQSPQDAVFGAVKLSLGASPHFEANAQPIRDAITALFQNPKMIVPALSVLATFLPPQGKTIVGGIIGLINVMPSPSGQNPAPAVDVTPVGSLGTEAPPSVQEDES